jgi:hypothetical protein
MTCYLTSRDRRFAAAVAGGVVSDLRTTLTGEIAKLTPEPVTEYPMVPIDENLFLVREPQAQTWSPVTFYQLPKGEKYLHFGVRATPKVS